MRRPSSRCRPYCTASLSSLARPQLISQRTKHEPRNTPLYVRMRHLINTSKLYVQSPVFKRVLCYASDDKCWQVYIGLFHVRKQCLQWAPETFIIEYCIVVNNHVVRGECAWMKTTCLENRLNGFGPTLRVNLRLTLVWKSIQTIDIFLQLFLQHVSEAPDLMIFFGSSLIDHVAAALVCLRCFGKLASCITCY